jgi:hypothetical protein
LGNFLRPSFFKCPKASLVHQQASFPIIKSGIGFVSLEVITTTMYLGNKGLVDPIIASRFLQDGHPFLLKVIQASNSSPLPF